MTFLRNHLLPEALAIGSKEQRAGEEPQGLEAVHIDASDRELAASKRSTAMAELAPAASEAQL
ncbi:hypothetical protein AB4Y32_18425 [Paraburkholderia phymatum]|uniref:Uncharacterized protein n=1 Tax=Paraburkholderia phymatum TaxID=148447 RepID=A0ACC6U239_9BURK